MSVDVLLVDDDRDVLEALETRLSLSGFTVLACASYIEAVDHLSPGFQGCIVTDIRMPGKSGLDLLHKANATDPELPVIVLTGFAQTATVVSAMRHGAVTVLEKPCPMPELIALVGQVLNQRQAVLKTRKTRAKRAVRGRPPAERALVAAIGRIRARTHRACLGAQ